MSQTNLGLLKSGWCTGSGDQISWADVNGDGVADMICYTWTSGYIYVILFKGGKPWKDLGRVHHWGTGNTYYSNWADVNGDGIADLILDGRNIPVR